MGDNDWDLNTMVRSCKIDKPNNVVTPNLGSETFENDDWDIFDRLLAADMTNFDSLAEISSIELPVAHQKKSDDQVIIMDQNNNQQLYFHPIQPTQFSQQNFLAASPTTVTCVPTSATPQEWIDMQQQQHLMHDNVDPDLTLPMKTPLTKTYKRKNQPERVFYEVSQEELTNDKWAWHKFGQKLLKGFPFPRNYYKCSAKLCEVKKTIEKSPTNENYFLVSYSGEHNHDPPTYRRPLIFYNSNSKYKLPRGINIVPKALSGNTSSLSSSKRAKRSKIDVSSICPTATTHKIESNNEMVNAVVENKNDVEKEENVNEDILMEFEELQGVTSSST